MFTPVELGTIISHARMLIEHKQDQVQVFPFEWPETAKEQQTRYELTRLEDSQRMVGLKNKLFGLLAEPSDLIISHINIKMMERALCSANEANLKLIRPNWMEVIGQREETPLFLTQDKEMMIRKLMFLQLTNALVSECISLGINNFEKIFFELQFGLKKVIEEVDELTDGLTKVPAEEFLKAQSEFIKEKILADDCRFVLRLDCF